MGSPTTQSECVELDDETSRMGRDTRCSAWDKDDEDAEGGYGVLSMQEFQLTTCAPHRVGSPGGPGSAGLST